MQILMEKFDGGLRSDGRRSVCHSIDQEVVPMTGLGKARNCSVALLDLDDQARRATHLFLASAGCNVHSFRSPEAVLRSRQKSSADVLLAAVSAPWSEELFDLLPALKHSGWEGTGILMVRDDNAEMLPCFLEGGYSAVISPLKGWYRPLSIEVSLEDLLCVRPANLID
ncbi:hypothetical protein [Sphingomonas sp.]|uniref:hypothetical protein n=2 Tax=Sphingomonas TaxID=13687 RepID=UPI0008363A89